MLDNFLFTLTILGKGQKDLEQRTLNLLSK